MAAPPDLEKLDFHDPDQLRAWLEMQEMEASVALAVRAALRIVPNLGPLLANQSAETHDTAARNVLSPILRALAIVWVAVAFPSRRPAPAIDRVPEIETDLARAVEVGESFGARAVVEAVRHAFLAFPGSRSNATDEAAESITLAGEAAEELAEAVYSEFIADGLLITGGMSAQNLAVSSLWRGELPDPASRNWSHLEEMLLNLQQDWNVWIDWYEARLRGDPPVEDLEIARATIDEKTWQQGPAAVNRHILDLEARYSSGAMKIDRKTAPEAEQAAPDPGPVPEPVEPARTPPAVDGYADLTFLDDRPDTESDVLGRSNLAFMLAGKLNQIWDALNREPEPPPADAANTFDSSTWAPQADFEREPQLADGAFVVHVDAPWGGGKTTFANYLARILNPYVHPGPLPDWKAMEQLAEPDFSPAHFRRPWHIVQFNAWQHQHVSPPWWAFYQVIRREGFHGIRSDTNRITGSALEPPAGYFRPWPARQTEWLWLWLRELGWRLFSPKNNILIGVFVLSVIVGYVLYQNGLLVFTDKRQIAVDVKSVSGETVVSPGDVSAFAATALTVLAGGGAFIWTIISTLTESLLPGTASAAKNYSLGAGDPLERFRRNFAGTLKRLRRPVLVVIDDLDRCKPDFVVELVRGMQTILRSPRVVFLILGDRDWIEQAFAEQHKAMEGIDVGPEHSFGGRFVEKAIQMSFVLPEVDEDLRGDYVKALLNIYQPDDQPSADARPAFDAIVADIEQKVSKAGSIDDRDMQVAELKKRVESEFSDVELQQTVTRQINQAAALSNATDARLHAATQHRLVPLSPVLPANPRQIKRIINAVSLYQEIARIALDIQPRGDPRWQQLAQWVVLMTEYPQTWFTLSLHPGLADLFHNPTAARGVGLPDSKIVDHWLAQMHATEMVPKLMAFSGWQPGGAETRIDTDAVLLFKPLMPATSGRKLAQPE